MLRDHKEGAFARGLARPENLVFSSTTGAPLHQRNVLRRGLGHAVEHAGLGGDGRPRLRFHDLRHTFASLLIAKGMNVVFVSRKAEVPGSKPRSPTYGLKSGDGSAVAMTISSRFCSFGERRCAGSGEARPGFEPLVNYLGSVDVVLDCQEEGSVFGYLR